MLRLIMASGWCIGELRMSNKRIDAGKKICEVFLLEMLGHPRLFEIASPSLSTGRNIGKTPRTSFERIPYMLRRRKHPSLVVLGAEMSVSSSLRHPQRAHPSHHPLVPTSITRGSTHRDLWPSRPSISSPVKGLRSQGPRKDKHIAQKRPRTR